MMRRLRVSLVVWAEHAAVVGQRRQAAERVAAAQHTSLMGSCFDALLTAVQMRRDFEMKLGRVAQMVQVQPLPDTCNADVCCVKPARCMVLRTKLAHETMQMLLFCS